MATRCDVDLSQKIGQILLKPEIVDIISSNIEMLDLSCRNEEMVKEVRKNLSKEMNQRLKI